MRPQHNLVELPAGKTLADVLPVFKNVEDERHIGMPTPVCAGCRKPFTAVRKRRKAFRLYPVDICQAAPVAFAYSLCGRCWSHYQAGGDRKEALMASIDAFSDGSEATQ
ncbi:hypothetical protein [Candidatus Accumulibacter sp. ACC007]|uniref:hypothetical protein n=1 Tax=Candidatus Accumulibacter sp. ACC007 TaxID=2823333 RepID=UPI0025B8D3F9|nr:hypothetical protein [Candidatus Accumulibacter sp. ACC007]